MPPLPPLSVSGSLSSPAWHKQLPFPPVLPVPLQKHPEPVSSGVCFHWLLPALSVQPVSAKNCFYPCHFLHCCLCSLRVFLCLKRQVHERLQEDICTLSEFLSFYRQSSSCSYPSVASVHGISWDCKNCLTALSHSRSRVLSMVKKFNDVPVIQYIFPSS